MAQRPIRIATRASKLALWQAYWVRDALLARDPTLDITLLEMTTEGDRFLAAPLAKVGGKGLFVKELETAMLDGRADLAVHSMKDVPVAFPEGLGLSVICARKTLAMPLSPEMTLPRKPSMRSLPELGWARLVCAAQARLWPFDPIW